MIWIDIVILVIVALSAIISLMRGFVAEALSLAAWVLAFWVSISFTYNLAATPWMTGFIESPTARIVVAFAALFFLTLLAGALVNHLIRQLVRRTGLSGTDRMLGVVFGIARGVVLVGVLVLMAGLTQLPKEQWWSESMLLHHFEAMALWMQPLLPADVQSNIQY